SVSSNRRAVARLISVRRATSLNVNSGCSPSKEQITAMPRSNDCTKSVPFGTPPCSDPIIRTFQFFEHVPGDPERRVGGWNTRIDRDVHQDAPQLLHADPTGRR